MSFSDTLTRITLGFYCSSTLVHNSERLDCFPTEFFFHFFSFSVAFLCRERWLCDFISFKYCCNDTFYLHTAYSFLVRTTYWK